ncbi:MAG: hypothetical protein ACRDOT_08195, partial [Aeromicrobium sp.]
MAQDLQGLRFNVSDETPALHVVDPPPERPTQTMSRSSWERKVARRILFTDALVVAFAVAVAHVLRYYVIPVPPDILAAVQPGVWEISIGIFVGWMIALSVFRTRDPKTFDNGSRQYQRVARSTFTLFGWVAIAA